MELRCKPGDLAIIIWTEEDPHYKQNLGKIVQVVSFWGMENRKVQGMQPIWTVTLEGETRSCADSSLQPIRAQPQTTKHKKEVTQ